MSLHFNLFGQPFNSLNSNIVLLRYYYQPLSVFLQIYKQYNAILFTVCLQPLYDGVLARVDSPVVAPAHRRGAGARRSLRLLIRSGRR
jgi:hypothetical protein